MTLWLQNYGVINFVQFFLDHPVEHEIEIARKKTDKKWNENKQKEINQKRKTTMRHVNQSFRLP